MQLKALLAMYPFVKIWAACPYMVASTVRAPVFGRHQFIDTLIRALWKSPWSLLSGWMNYNYTACCWFPTSSNILILPSQFWQIRFESCWLHCSKCWILVLLRYMLSVSLIRCNNEVLKKLHFKALLTHWRLVQSILGLGSMGNVCYSKIKSSSTG